MNQVAQQTPLVVVGGWGVDAAMLLPLFDGWPGEIHLVSLTDAIMTRCETITEVVAYLLDHYPCRSVWVGWSQGAQVAMAAALQSAGSSDASSALQVSGVITLAGFPWFVAAPGWPVGMAASTFATFRAGVVNEAGETWRRFQQLLIHGCDDLLQARQELRPWVSRGASVTRANLVRGLDWLETEDQRDLWQSLRVPALHLQAGEDAVVRSWSDTLAPAEASEVITVPGMTHWPRGQRAMPCREAIRQFVFGRGDSWRL
ncbi:MAG: alpha/beta fold hydrolase [Marinobacter sp.]|uniref:alpha/beta fold hydrolase n=1 Tax=Marinobacter sp. TaxID=50741 RepID=UPI003296FEE5